MADFLTVNLSAILKNQAPATKTNTAPAQQAAGKPIKKLTADEWAALLKERLEANSKLGPEARESDYAIETQFFKEYFNAEWNNTEVVDQLILMGEPLKKAIKVLGFNKNTNPILAFISNDLVIETIIKPKLLNESTFKAIYNAVAQKLVAHSQFLKPNDYNIIYYPDLYRKPVGEIMMYLKLQNKLLPANASRYIKADLIRNKKVFISIPDITGKTFSEKRDQINKAEIDVNFGADKIADIKASVVNAKLNDIKFAEMLTGKQTVTPAAGAQNKTMAKKVLVKKLNSPAKKLAAIQYIGITTNSTEAKKALANEAFAEVSRQDLLNVTMELTGNMPKKVMSDTEADELVKQIMSDL